MDKTQIKIDYIIGKKNLKNTYKRKKRQFKTNYKETKLKLKLSYKQNKKNKISKQNYKHSKKANKKNYKNSILSLKYDYVDKKISDKSAYLSAINKEKPINAPSSLAGTISRAYIIAFSVFSILQSVLIAFGFYYFLMSKAEQNLSSLENTLNKNNYSTNIIKSISEDESVSILVTEGDKTIICEGNSKIDKTLLKENEKAIYKTRYKAKNYMVLSKDISVDNKDLRLNIIKDLSNENVFLSVLINILLITLVLFLIISGFIAYSISKKKLRPIHTMTRTIKEISTNDLSKRIDTSSVKSELFELGVSFNLMMDKIEDSYQRQKEFVSGASHELRTPLSVISGYADILARWGTEDKSVLDEAIASINDQTSYMRILLDRLLYMVKADDGTINNIDLKANNISSLVSELLNDFSLITKDHKIISKVDKDIYAYCDKFIAKQILTILIDNAIKFTPVGKEIVINAFQDNKKTTISVTDNGIGIEKDKLDKIFERFYKIDESRSQKGFGLGLSIAKSLITAVGGNIYCESEISKGSTFYVEFLNKK